MNSKATEEKNDCAMSGQMFAPQQLLVPPAPASSAPTPCSPSQQWAQHGKEGASVQRVEFQKAGRQCESICRCPELNDHEIIPMSTNFRGWLEKKDNIIH